MGQFTEVLGHLMSAGPSSVFASPPDKLGSSCDGITKGDVESSRAM